LKSSAMGLLLLGFLLMGIAGNLIGGSKVQDDPVLAPNLTSPPVIDGHGNDDCWQNISWQSIDQVWIPWGGTIPDDDYSGRYKIAWSQEENLLYFLVEIEDDYFVDGYQFGQTADIYHYDIIEVFIDEDHSGGLHVFDGTGSVAQQYGSNAENAFAYHMYCPFPDPGKTATALYVGDLDGTGWSDAQSPNYASHFPAFAMVLNNHTAVREFSLIVYDDTYENNRADQSRVQLVEGKVIGLSLACCDNDGVDENPKTRDNFFGSVAVPEQKYNDHWMDAGGFGTVKLIGLQTSVESNRIDEQHLNLYPNPNPADGQFHMELKNSYHGELVIQLFNVLGQEVLKLSDVKTGTYYSHDLFLYRLPKGLYFLRTCFGTHDLIKKLLIH
jgi:hypothetical protein